MSNIDQPWVIKLLPPMSSKQYWNHINRHGVPNIEYSKEDCALWRVCIEGKTRYYKEDPYTHIQPPLDLKGQEILHATI